MLKRRCQSLVLVVPHQIEKRGMRGSTARSCRSGKWLATISFTSAGNAASRASVASTRAAHQSSRVAIRIGREQIFIGRSHAGLRGPRHRLVASDRRRPERIVEQQERRHDRARRAVARPPRVRILRRQHAVFAAQRHQPLVVRDAALCRRQASAASTDRDCPASRPAARSAAAACAARSRGAPAFRRCRRR